MNKQTLIKSAAILGGGIAIGYFVGYFNTKVSLKKKYESFIEQEIASVKESYKMLRKEDEYATPEQTVEALQGHVEDLGYSEGEDGEGTTVFSKGGRAVQEFVDRVSEDDWEADREPEDVPDEDTPEPVIINVFDQNHEDELDEFDKLYAERDVSKPYVISAAEFMQDEEDFDKISIAYFEGDDTLVDEREALIPDVEATVGHGNLSHFGAGSNDENILYVRNERIQSDFEIVRDERTYSEVILGLSTEWDTETVKEPKKRKKSMED